MTDRLLRVAATVHRNALVWDNHTCLPHRIESGWMERLSEHRAAGVTFISINLGDADVPFEMQVRLARHIRAWVNDHSDTTVMADSIATVRRAKRDGRLAIGFDVEGAKSLGEDVERVFELRDLGVRWMSLVFNRANQMGGGVHDAADGGLTPLGRRFVCALESAGITICCSHTGHRTVAEILDRAIGPVIFSHSNANAVHAHPRNIPDALIRRCAESGGVVGINGLHIFLGGRDHMIDRYVRHIDHVVQLVGPAHVGIGLDYVFDQEDMNAQLQSARGTWPSGFGYEPGIQYLEPSSLPHVTEALLARGYSEHDVIGILGGNFLRVAEATWR